MGLDISVRATGIAVIGLDGPNEPDIGGLPLPGERQPFFTDVSGYALADDATFDQVHTRIGVIRKRIVEVAKEYRPELVAIEDIVFANEGSAKAQIWGMNLLVQHTIFRLGIPCRMVPLDTWRGWLGIAWQSIAKKHPGVTGSQRSRILKGMVRERLKHRFGVDFDAKDHNQAEAFAIAQFAAHRARFPDEVQQTLGIEIAARRRRK